MRPMPAFGPRAVWKAIAITATDPTEFAKQYESTMNGLVADGWSVAGMMERGGGLIITAQKPNLSPALLQALEELATGKKPTPKPADVQEEVTYCYKEGDEIHSMRCADLEEAVGYFKEHIMEDSAILPINIIVMTVTSYEPADLPLLTKLVK
jgi:hypothetical protein